MPRRHRHSQTNKALCAALRNAHRRVCPHRRATLAPNDMLVHPHVERKFETSGPRHRWLPEGAVAHSDSGPEKGSTFHSPIRVTPSQAQEAQRAAARRRPCQRAACRRRQRRHPQCPPSQEVRAALRRVPQAWTRHGRSQRRERGFDRRQKLPRAPASSRCCEPTQRVARGASGRRGFAKNLWDTRPFADCVPRQRYPVCPSPWSAA